VLHDPRWQHYVAAHDDMDDALASELEHAHGCLAYVPDAAPRVAALTVEGDAWTRAAGPRLGDCFAGSFDTIAALTAGVASPAWVVVDRLERWDDAALAALAAGGFSLVLFASNARSFETFQGVVSGTGTFADGRALGRTEVLAELAGAGYRIERLDRVMSQKIAIPLVLPTGYAMSMGSFSFTAMDREALYDFLAVGFVLRALPDGG
jgi:hypothetical protein